MEERIYYLLDPAASEIKIGITCDLELRQRVLSHERGVELQLLGTHRGTVNDERLSHAACAAYRVTGEWFKDCDKVRRHIHSRLEQKLAVTLKQVQRLIETFDDHGRGESDDWRADIQAAIREEMAEYLRLLDICEHGQSAVAA